MMWETKMHSPRLALCFSVLAILGCDQSRRDEEAVVPIAKAKPIGVAASPRSTLPAGESTERMYGGMKFDIPAGWEEKATASTMIVAEFGLPGGAGPGRLTLSLAGGGTAANMDRWRGQFRRGPTDPEPTEAPISAAGKAATLIDVRGTYSDTFGGGGSKPDWELLGVASPIDEDHNYFVKLTGPQETVAAHRDEFLKFIASARFEH